MAKKTPAEYEAMIGGLMHRIENLSDELGCAKHNWEQWQARAEKAEGRVQFLEGTHNAKCGPRVTASSTITGSR